jgi:hypothetical protein
MPRPDSLAKNLPDRLNMDDLREVSVTADPSHQHVRSGNEAAAVKSTPEAAGISLAATSDAITMANNRPATDPVLHGRGYFPAPLTPLVILDANPTCRPKTSASMRQT